MLHCINCDYGDLLSGKLYEEGGKVADNLNFDIINIENADSLMELSKKITHKLS